MAEIMMKDRTGYNRALGCYVKSNNHYKELMARGGFVEQEKAQQIASASKSNDIKDYTVSKEAEKLLNVCRSRADKEGNVRMSGRLKAEIEKRKSRRKKNTGTKRTGGFGDY